ncbi:unnamed protein product [Bursaphelenchus okinawaensis]|uniref:Uncharacterized protein n=1 Tax=Bursaphelenchus okinawaensis TaxID=465554 RepID=A0A811LRW2_9BILA|nr:unnamed protein product [Bursaphelenchus okinawaensis]CAG9127736.1 unnamed protein product [Bursaphelenchus okinawaensis]
MSAFGQQLQQSLSILKRELQARENELEIKKRQIKQVSEGIERENARIAQHDAESEAVRAHLESMKGQNDLIMDNTRNDFSTTLRGLHAKINEEELEARKLKDIQEFGGLNLPEDGFLTLDTQLETLKERYETAVFECQEYQEKLKILREKRLDAEDALRAVPFLEITVELREMITEELVDARRTLRSRIRDEVLKSHQLKAR